MNPPQAPNVKAMTDGNYRLRVGDWRVVYALRHDVLTVLVLRVGHRREVYR
jgi:mRNA interferase RelE/StbE